jgi:putative oxygen-independent coproporphyrinogen III oxidase
MVTSTDPIPISLYVHLPWCEKKCPYCDFNSHEVKGPTDFGGYIDSLILDLSNSLGDLNGRTVKSIFIGGGTPSLTPSNLIDKLVYSIQSMVNCRENLEITMEANPGSSEINKFKEFRNAGINRLSIGVQSFNDRFLKQLGRIHTGVEAKAAVNAANEVFDRVNIDLMYALPGQDISALKDDLDLAIGSGVGHISYYQLTIEPNTYFYKYTPKIPEDEVCYEMQELIRSSMYQSGLSRYEVSAFCRNSEKCDHNMNYWEFGDYLGIGAGAHSKITQGSIIRRSVRLKHPDKYINAISLGESAIQSSSEVKECDRPVEFFMNALRLVEGVDRNLFSKRACISERIIREQLDVAIKRGLLVNSRSRFQPTELGINFLNDLLEIFC